MIVGRRQLFISEVEDSQRVRNKYHLFHQGVNKPPAQAQTDLKSLT